MRSFLLQPIRDSLKVVSLQNIDHSDTLSYRKKDNRFINVSTTVYFNNVRATVAEPIF